MSTDPLRPATLAEFTGQDDTVRELSIVLAGASSRQENPPHVLLSGPPGLGKTTLASIIAHEAGLPLVLTSAPMLDKPGDLVSLLVSLDRPSVVFVDEIHRLPRPVEETLYSAMEDGRVDIVLAEGTARAKTISMPLAHLTLVGATTNAGALGAPFRDRFGYIARLRPYDTPTLAQIVSRNAGLLGMHVDTDAAGLIAARSRGTPRIANRLLGRVRDYAGGLGRDHVDAVTADEALTLFGIDPFGLDVVDRDLLTQLCVAFHGGPVGVATLAAAIGESVETLESVHEPYLMRAGLLARTSRGRVATRAAYTHLNLPVPAHLSEPEPALFDDPAL